jgi:integrase
VLRRGDLQLDGSSPCVKVRRSCRMGRMKPPKSRHGVRDVPLCPGLVGEFRTHLAKLPPGEADALAFPSESGGVLDPSNVRRRVLRPAAEEASASWCGFHTFRHTYASLMLAGGANVVELSRLLGHHSPSLTLSRYAHLIPGDSAPTLDLDAELTSKLSADGAGISRNQPEANLAEALVFPANHGLDQNQLDSAGIVVTSS